MRLDLDYADPAPPPTLIGNARERGRTVRRRRRAGGALAAAGAVAAIAVLGTQLIGGTGTGDTGRTHLTDPAAGRPTAQAADLSKLPVAEGTGPQLVEFAAARQFRAAPEFETWTPVGDVLTIGTIPAGREQGNDRVFWLTDSGTACLGDRDPKTDRPRPQVCSGTLGKETPIPQEGLYDLGNIGYGEGDPNSGEPNPSMHYGLVRGPVDRVTVDVGQGPMDAKLAPAPVPELGTFYWFEFDDTMKADASDAGGQRTVYRDGRPVYHCAGDECLGQP